MSKPNQWTAISMPLVMGSTLPTLSKTMLTVLMKIFQMQYSEKKYPRKLKYFPWKHKNDVISKLLSRGKCRLMFGRKGKVVETRKSCFSYRTGFYCHTILLFSVIVFPVLLFLHSFYNSFKMLLLFQQCSSCIIWRFYCFLEPPTA